MTIKFNRRVLAAVASIALTVSFITQGMVSITYASSHREAPFTVADPLADNTDVYAFVSPDRPDSVTLIANFIPFEEPAGGPNFYPFDPSVLYEIKIDNNGDAVEDITYQFRYRTFAGNPNTFLYNSGPINSLGDPAYNFKQFYSVTEIARQANGSMATRMLVTEERFAPVPPDSIGIRSTVGNYEGRFVDNSIMTAGSAFGNIRIFTGQRDDGFYFDIGSFFDLLGLRPFNDVHQFPRARDAGRDGVAGFNVKSLALQIPIRQLTRNNSQPTALNDPNAVIGVWATASRQTTRVLAADGSSPTVSGPFVQVSRLGNPLVNELIIPIGTTQPGVVAGTKDRFNASQPANDAQFLGFVQDPEPARLIDQLYPSIQVPPPPRNDVVSVFLTGIAGLNQPPNVVPSEQMRLNVAVPPRSFATANRLGVLGGDMAGFPNGRRPADDVVDIELRVLAGVLVPGFNIAPNNQLGDGANQNDVPFRATFPYLGSPTDGYNSPHARIGSITP